MTDDETGEQLKTRFMVICSPNGRKANINLRSNLEGEIIRHNQIGEVAASYLENNIMYAVIEVVQELVFFGKSSNYRYCLDLKDPFLCPKLRGYILESVVKKQLPRAYEKCFNPKPLPEDDIPL